MVAAKTSSGSGTTCGIIGDNIFDLFFRVACFVTALLEKTDPLNKAHQDISASQAWKETDETLNEKNSKIIVNNDQSNK